MDPAIFKANDIRGLYGEQFDESDAWKIGNAAARFLPSLIRGYERGLAETRRMVVGYDMRQHSDGLAESLINGIRCAGLDVLDIGMIDSPQLSFAINHFKSCGGIQVTASHNPAEYNGFKISGMRGTPIGHDTGLTDIKHLATSLLHTKGNPSGVLEKQDLTDLYKEHILRFLPSPVRRMKIAIDASNGMAGKMVPAVLGDLDLDIVSLNFKHDGNFKHEPNPLNPQNLTQLKRTITKQECDFGVCFDGDADRLILLDEKGKTVSCDLMTALMTPYFLQQQPNAAIVYDLRSSRVVQEEIIHHGGTPRRERVGHAFMKKAMKDSQAVFGGELSGHFYFADNFCSDSGLIALVTLLHILGSKESTVSEVIKPLQRYASSGEINFHLDDSQAALEQLTKAYPEGEVDYLDGVTITLKNGWFNCRASNTEPYLRLIVEANSKTALNQQLKDLKSILGEPISG